MFENLRADLRRSMVGGKEGWWKRHPSLELLRAFGNVGVWPVVVYRFGHWATKVRVPLVGLILRLLALIMRHAVMIWTGVFINPNAEIGPGFAVHTWVGVFVGKTKIGANCTVGSGVVIPHSTRSIGDNVYFGAGAKLVGDTKIGNNVVIMSNSLVMVDVADNTSIVGVPARIKLRGGQRQIYYAQKPSNGTGGKANSEAASTAPGNSSAAKDGSLKAGGTGAITVPSPTSKE
jgi:serine O-acetyltransferase